MTETELRLVAMFGPATPLGAICWPCFGLDLAEAKKRAALHRSPLPTFRLRNSSAAPVMVLTSAFAAYMDSLSQAVVDDLVINGSRWGDGPQDGGRVAEMRRRISLQKQVTEGLERFKEMLDEQAAEGNAT